MMKSTVLEPKPSIQTDCPSPAVMHAALLSEWPAELSGRFQRDRHGATQLVRLSHRGPLRIQRLFQTGPWAECYLLHPPGGLVTGDSLAIEMMLAEKACVLVTTPAAGKVYGARHTAGWQQTEVRLQMADETGLAWLPQDTICFDRARVRQSFDISVAPTAWHVGWEQVTFGRRASNAPFQSGQFSQSVCIHRAGIALYRDRISITADVLASFAGLAGLTVMAVLWIVLPEGHSVIPAIEIARQSTPSSGLWTGATAVTAELGIVRVLGDDALQVRQYLESLWTDWTPLCVGQSVHPPRIWRT